MKRIVFAMALAWLGALGSAHAEVTCPAKNFTADPGIAQIAEAYALDAQDFAQRAALGPPLDRSDASIQHVEAILETLYDQKDIDNPSPEEIFKHAKMFGSYVGEVYRQNHGAVWGMVALDGEDFPGLCTGAGVLFWPWGKVDKRLSVGPEDNVWHYYQVMVADGAKR